MKKSILFTLFNNLLILSNLQAADIKSLKTLFKETYNTQYKHGLCGRNIQNFVKEASVRGINLENSYVAKIVGAGFLETSGFFTRSKKNEREMLGYFHMIFIADNYVFDFDLAEERVPTLENYVRLQFTPPQKSYFIFGVEYDPKKELPWWKVIRFEWSEYVNDTHTPTWQKKITDLINLDEVLKLPRD